MDKTQYGKIHDEITSLLQASKVASARSVNALMTATYWEIGRRIGEFEQQGQHRAEYGEALIKRLAEGSGRAIRKRVRMANLTQMRAFFLGWPPSKTFWMVCSLA